MSQDKISVSEESMDKIRSRAKAIKLISKDRQVIKIAEEIMQIAGAEIDENSLDIMGKIEKKMKETKFTDPDLNANLYILYRNLMDKKISEKDAEELYEMYSKFEPFDKKIY